MLTSDTTLVSKLSIPMWTPTATMSAPNLHTCYSLPGGYDPSTDTTLAGCGGMLTHLASCIATQGHWADPYDNAQSASFQACFCETSASTPFGIESALYQNYSSCAHCLLMEGEKNMDVLAEELGAIQEFCTAQFPLAYLYLSDFSAWLDGIEAAARGAGDTSDTGPPAVYNLRFLLETLSPLFTTTPPLANTPFAASGGKFSDVTPALTTFTEAGATITALASWVPTATGVVGGTTGAKTSFDASQASAEQAGRVSSQLYGGLESARVPSLCFGRGPCGELPNEAVGRTRRSGWKWGIGVFGWVVGWVGVG